MTFTGFLIFLIIAAICGAIGQAISGYSLGGCFASIIIGFIGAWLGPLIADHFDFPLFYTFSIQGKEIPIVWAIIGSALFSLFLGIFTKRRNES